MRGSNATRGRSASKIMALYKICRHKGRARDRCAHAWWGSWGYKGRLYRQSLQKWSGEDIT